MLGFVQNFFAPKCNPIGVDFGSDCLRLIQVQRGEGGNEFKLIAAASADVPAHVRHDPGAPVRRPRVRDRRHRAGECEP